MKINLSVKPIKYWLAIILTASLYSSNAQSIGGIQTDASRLSNIYTAVPFLLITPQPRSAAMGNAGVALDADANASTINTSALAFLPEGDIGASFSYSPWLRQLASGMSISLLTGYYRLNERNTVSASLRYFSIGNVNFSDDNFQDLGVYNPSEFAFDIGYALKLGPGFALGGNLRYISSNLIGGGAVNNVRAGKAVAVDVSALEKSEIQLGGTPAILSFGIGLSNIGTKMIYGNSLKSYFLPANFKIGSALKMGEGTTKVTFALDFNKLMAPTQPIYDADGNIVKGKDPDRSVPAGIIGSFSDAPGGFREELQEVGISAGTEVSFKDALYLRTGYLYQNPQKADNSYFTLGLGVRYSSLAFDFSYLIGSGQSPLRNTLRFGLQAHFGKIR
ncbi:type IX secretion system outer membrane channel protein PorV [Pedobacter vanadiisoli]|uniref:Type IX secretion system outer membrane channel protein PorV n=1 Tax=Pedobacter vanadiisoli TaxID=1761975 RepID=A0ABW5MGL5_9SPHI